MFYVILNKRFDDSQYAYGEYRYMHHNTGDCQYCKGCGSPIGKLEWLPPYEIKVSKKKLGDFIYGNFPGFIISQRVKDDFEQMNLKGIYDYKKVNVYYRNQLLSVDYYYPVIKILYTHIDTSYFERAKNQEGKKLCPTCQKGCIEDVIYDLINGIHFLNPNEIHEDVFHTTIFGQGIVYMSEAFKKVIDEKKYTNINYIESTKYKYDFLGRDLNLLYLQSKE